MTLVNVKHTFQALFLVIQCKVFAKVYWIVQCYLKPLMCFQNRQSATINVFSINLFHFLPYQKTSTWACEEGNTLKRTLKIYRTRSNIRRCLWTISGKFGQKWKTKTSKILLKKKKFKIFSKLNFHQLPKAIKIAKKKYCTCAHVRNI